MVNNFTINTNVCEMESFADFAKEFSIGKGDLILTDHFAYEAVMADLDLSCDFLFYSDYLIGEPTEAFWLQMIGIMKDKPEVRRIIGVGGGTIMDTAKLLSFKGVESPVQVFKKTIPLVKDKECILIPTTCGTGSEMDGIIAGILDELGKVGIGLVEAHADQAVLIPEMIKGLPYKPFMFTSADALVHCMETSVSPSAHPFAEVYAFEGIRNIIRMYCDIRENGPEARFNHLKEAIRSSAYAGICLSHGPCGASHAMAHYFGLIHHIAHGEVNAMFVMPTFRFYARHKESELLDRMAKTIADAAGKPEMNTVETFDFLDQLFKDIVPMKTFKDYGVKAEDLPAYADVVLETQQRLLIQSYIIPMQKEDLIEIYTDMLNA